MSASINQATIIGHLGQDPEVRAAGSRSVCRLRVATSRKWSTEDGGKQEETTWHNVSAWGQLGATCAKYLKRGRYVRVVGRMRHSTYQDKDGIERRAFEVVAHSVDFLDSGASKPTDASKNESRPWDDAEPDHGGSDDIPF
jgi:single-strand DNA-binding protein